MGIDEVGSNLIYLYDLLTKEGKFRSSEKKPITVMIPKEDWIEGYKNTADKPEIADYMTIDEACQYIEDHDLESVLKRKVMRKWNDREDEAEKKILKRKRKNVL